MLVDALVRVHTMVLVFFRSYFVMLKIVGKISVVKNRQLRLRYSLLPPGV